MRKGDRLFTSKKKRSALGPILFVLFALAVLVGCSVMYNQVVSTEMQLLNERVRVMGLDKSYEGFTVLHISDLQAQEIGSDTAKWKKLLLQKHFDCVVCTGDMVGKTGNAEPFLSLIHTIQYLRPNVPIFFVDGDADPQAVQTAPHGSAEVLADWVVAAQKLSAVYLDSPQWVSCGKNRVWITPQYLYDMDIDGMIATLERKLAEMEQQGMHYETENGALYRSVQYRLEVMHRTKEAAEQMTDRDLQIAVNHAPLSADYVRTQIEWSDSADVFRFRAVDLLLCGHNCGGGWKLPGGKTLYLSGCGIFPPEETVQGMQRINSLNQYISPGIGAPSDSPFTGRFFNKPAITLLKFTASIQ